MGDDKMTRAFRSAPFVCKGPKTGLNRVVEYAECTVIPALDPFSLRMTRKLCVKQDTDCDCVLSLKDVDNASSVSEMGMRKSLMI